MGQKSGKITFTNADGHANSKEATNGGPVQNGTEVTKGNVDLDVPHIDDVAEAMKMSNDEECNDSLSGRGDEGNSTISKPEKKKKNLFRWVSRKCSRKQAEQCRKTDEKNKVLASPKPVAEAENGPAAATSTEDTVVNENFVVSVEESATVYVPTAATSNAIEAPTVADVPESAENKEVASSVQPSEQSNSVLSPKHHVEIIHLPPTDSDVDSDKAEDYNPMDTNNTNVNTEQSAVNEAEVVGKVYEGVGKEVPERDEEQVNNEVDEQMNEEENKGQDEVKGQVHTEVEERVCEDEKEHVRIEMEERVCEDEEEQILTKEDRRVYEDVEEQVGEDGEKQVRIETEERVCEDEEEQILTKEDRRVYEDVEEQVGEDGEKQVRIEVEERVPKETQPSAEDKDSMNEVPDETGDNRYHTDRVNGALQEAGKESMLSKSEDEELTSGSPHQSKLSSIDHDRELTNNPVV